MSSLLEFVLRGMLLGVTYGVLALPIALLFVTTDAVDMAVGGYGVLAAAIVIALPGPLGIVVAILAAIAASVITALTALTINKPGAGDPMTGVLATYGIAIFLESFVLTTAGPDPLTLQSFGQLWDIGGIRVDPQVGVNIAVGLAALAALYVLLFRTPYGRAMRASALNPMGAALAGIPVWWVWFSTYVIGGGLAGVSGVLIVHTTGTTYSNGLPMTLTSFAAAVLFGLNGPARAFLGGIAMGLVEALSAGFLPGAWASSIPLLFIVFVLATGRASKQTLVGARA
jgi:branched-chain amino acid transport system permease protein